MQKLLSLLALVMLALVGTAATAGYYYHSGTTVEIEVEVTPTTGEAHVTYIQVVDGTRCTSGPHVATPNPDGPPGDVLEAPPKVPTGTDADGGNVSGDPWRISNGVVYKKTGPDTWKAAQSIKNPGGGGGFANNEPVGILPAPQRTVGALRTL